MSIIIFRTVHFNYCTYVKFSQAVKKLTSAVSESSCFSECVDCLVDTEQCDSRKDDAFRNAFLTKFTLTLLEH